MFSRNERGFNFFKTRAALKEKLEYSSFRSGLSPSIQGASKLAPSDHLPITVSMNEIFLMSWNLLSEEHISNFFLDIGRKEHFVKYSLRADGKKISWGPLLKEVGFFIIKSFSKNSDDIYRVQITPELLHSFIEEENVKVHKLQSTVESFSNKTQASDYFQAIKKLDKAINLQKDAEEFVSILLDSTHVRHSDFKNSLIHITEIAYSISDGYLQWPIRLQKIKENKRLIANLLTHDIFCFQECTNPQDMLQLLQDKANDKCIGKKFAMITHAMTINSKDNCVIIYNKTKFILEDYMTFGLSYSPSTGQYTKPCIIAKFSRDNEALVIGSIHHPGSGPSELPSIIDKVKQYEDIPVLILGDFNHSELFYASDMKGSTFSMIMPTSGTMAGFEYGNHNKAIDGVLTNSLSTVKVNILQQFAFAEQVTLPLKIELCLDQGTNCISNSF